MRVLTFIFALALVMGLSFGGSSLLGSHSVMAEEAAEEAGGEMADEAAGNEEGAEAAATEETAEGEIPGGDMEDDATK